MNELLIVLGVEVTLLLSVAVMKVYRWRTDVLTGPYVLKRQHPPTVPDARIRPDTTKKRLDRATAENDAPGRWWRLPQQRENRNPRAPDAKRPDARSKAA